MPSFYLMLEEEVRNEVYDGVCNVGRFMKDRNQIMDLLIFEMLIRGILFGWDL